MCIHCIYTVSIFILKMWISTIVQMFFIIDLLNEFIFVSNVLKFDEWIIHLIDSIETLIIVFISHSVYLFVIRKIKKTMNLFLIFTQLPNEKNLKKKCSRIPNFSHVYVRISISFFKFKLPKNMIDFKNIVV